MEKKLHVRNLTSTLKHCYDGSNTRRPSKMGRKHISLQNTWRWKKVLYEEYQELHQHGLIVVVQDKRTAAAPISKFKFSYMYFD